MCNFFFLRRESGKIIVYIYAVINFSLFRAAKLWYYF